MKPQIYHVDAFTSEPFRGNSAGVVLHADTLRDAQMQLIARELRHSETAFLLKSEESAHTLLYTDSRSPHLWSCHRGRALCSGNGTGVGKHHRLANLVSGPSSR